VLLVISIDYRCRRARLLQDSIGMQRRLAGLHVFNEYITSSPKYHCVDSDVVFDQAF
jgi:hypothetical protein